MRFSILLVVGLGALASDAMAENVRFFRWLVYGGSADDVLDRFPADCIGMGMCPDFAAALFVRNLK